MSHKSYEIDICVSIRKQNSGGSLEFNQRFPMQTVDLEKIMTLMGQFREVTAGLAEHYSAAAPSEPPSRLQDTQPCELNIRLDLRFGSYGDSMNFAQAFPLGPLTFAEVAEILTRLHEFTEAVKAEYAQAVQR